MEILIVNAHEDHHLIDDIVSHLHFLNKQGFSIRNRKQVLASAETLEAEKQLIEQAKHLILIVTNDFFLCNFCQRALSKTKNASVPTTAIYHRHISDFLIDELTESKEPLSIHWRSGWPG